MKRNTNIFDVIKEKLEIEKRSYDSAYESDQNILEGIKIAEEIINQVENKFHEEVSIYKYAMLYAENIMKHGVDISEKWETATQNTMALNQAYLRGCQDERDKFSRWQEENGFCEWKHYELDLLMPYGTSCGQSDLYDDSDDDIDNSDSV